MSQFPKDPRETWITGIGIVSSLGDGLEATWDALHQGRVNVDRKTYAPWMVHQCGAGTGLHAVFTLNRRPATSGSFIEGRHGIKFPPTQRFADTGTAAVEKRAEHGSNVLRWVSTAIDLFDGANRSAARL